MEEKIILVKCNKCKKVMLPREAENHKQATEKEGDEHKSFRFFKGNKR